MEPEEIRFRSGSEECAAWLFRPPDGKEPVPCVVMGSGISCVRDQGLDRFAERFSDAGFGALAFDYRHWGDSGGEPRFLADPRRQQGDFLAAIDFAESLDWVDPDRIAIWGYSLGGGHVQAVAAQTPGLAAAVCVAPVISGPRSVIHMGGYRHLLGVSADGLRDRLRGLTGRGPRRIPVAGPPASRALLNSPDSEPGYKAISPRGTTWHNEICPRPLFGRPYRLLGAAKRISCPALYCITEDDDVNPPELGKKAAARARQGELKLYPGGHFAPIVGDTFERVVEDQIEFLDRELTATRAGRPAAA